MESLYFRRDSDAQIQLKVSDNLIISEHLRFLGRINQRLKEHLKLKNFDYVSLEYNGKIAPISLQFLDTIAEGYIELTTDIIHYLKCNPTNVVKIKAINEIPEATQITVSYSKQEAQLLNIKQPHNIELLHNLLFKALNKGLEFYINKLKFKVIDINPSGYEFVIITRNSLVKVLEEQQLQSYITYEKIGGLKEQLERIKDLINLPIKNPGLFERMNIEPPRGILLYGPPGTGKTLLARAIANATQSNFYSINGPDIVSKFYGDSEKKLRSLFEKAKENSPSIIFIDEIDSIAPRRQKVYGDVEKRIVAQLLALMDGLEARGRIIIIGATNMPHAIDDALRRGGRFDVEIEIKPPDTKARLEILEIILQKTPVGNTVNLELIAKQKTNGFVGADLSVLCKEAGVNAIKRFISSKKVDLKDLVVEQEDFEVALKKVEPSSLREYNIEVPSVKWSDIAGLSETIEKIKDELETPLKNADLYKQYNFSAVRGILLYGPPGTGKTLIAKAIATELNYNFIAIRGPELLSKYVGETQQTIRAIFRKARNAAPTVIFMDEVDAICISRTNTNIQSSSHNVNIVGQILTEMDGISELKNVIVIGTTNRPDLIDKALIRPGRFDKLIEIPKPTEEGILEIFKLYLKNLPIENFKLDEIARIAYLNGLAGADIYAICRDSLALAINQNKDNILVTEKILLTCLERCIANNKNNLKNQLINDNYKQTTI